MWIVLRFYCIPGKKGKKTGGGGGALEYRMIIRGGWHLATVIRSSHRGPFAGEVVRVEQVLFIVVRKYVIRLLRVRTKIDQ